MTKVYISQGKRNRLKTPITVDLPETKTDLEKSLQSNILESLIFKMPRLVPFAIESPAMMKVATRMFIHNSGSQGAFLGTTRHILNFCKWANTTPDTLVSSCKNSDGSPNSAANQRDRTFDR